MSPLPSPEERRKRLSPLSLDDILGRSRQADRGPRKSFQRSAGAEERERQRAEARRRAKLGSRS